ncbi:hypothetical protein OROHE_008334 [Orobanche hederae]
MTPIKLSSSTTPCPNTLSVQLMEAVSFDMTNWADCGPPPANFMVVTGERDLIPTLQHLHNREFNILLAHPDYEDEKFSDLAAFASCVWKESALKSWGGNPTVFPMCCQTGQRRRRRRRRRRRTRTNKNQTLQKFRCSGSFTYFNWHSGKRIQYLMSSGLVEKIPAAVPQFLRNTPDNVRHTGKESMSSGDECIRESTIHSLQLLCNLFNTFYEQGRRGSFILEFFLLAIVGITANQGFYLVGLDNTSPTFASAIQNSVPAITFLMAALLRIEKVRLDRKDGISKVAGLLICVAALHELLNNFGSYLSNHHDAVYENGSIVGRDASVNGFPLESNRETVRPMDMEGSEGTPSPFGRTTPTDGGVLQRNQTLGQKIVGNLMDNIFTRSFTSKQKIHTPDP